MIVCMVFQIHQSFEKGIISMAIHEHFSVLPIFSIQIFYKCYMYFAADPDTFCSQNPTAIIPHPDSCAQYINCANKNTELGNYREECLYMQLFSTYTNSCRPYREVKCGIRPEPRAPCKFKKIKYVY